MPLDVLEVEGQVGDRAEQPDADDEADRAGDAEDAIAEDLQRQDRLGGPRLDEDERGEQDETAHDHHEQLRRTPGIGRAAEARVEHDRREAARQEGCAEVVDLVARPVRARLEGGRDHRERDQADRQVDVEDPAPGQVVDEEPTEQRPDHCRDAEDGAEEALVATAVARRDDVADDGDRDHEEAAAAQSLDRPKDDQLGHVLADPAQRRAGEEDHDRRLQDELASVEIADLAVERAGDRRGEQVGGDDPGELGDPAQVADDRRQRRRDDRLIQRCQQQHEQERAEDQAHPLPFRAGRSQSCLRSALRQVRPPRSTFPSRCSHPKVLRARRGSRSLVPPARPPRRRCARPWG